MSAPGRYDAVSMLLHWLMAACILILFGLGWYMVELPKGGPERTYFFALHKSIGLTTAVLLIIRIGWRLAHAAPALPDSMRGWQKKLANSTHVLLYVLMFVQPLSGYLSSSFSGYSTRFWGLALPQWAPQDTVVNEMFTEIHVASSVLLLCVVTLHLLGGLGHLFSLHTNVLVRMWPGSGSAPQ